MPVPPSKKSPFDTIEAASAGLLESKRMREELFHLERSIATSSRDQQYTADCVADLEKSVDNLNETVGELNATMEKVELLLTKLCERLETDET